MARFPNLGGGPGDKLDLEVIAGFLVEDFPHVQNNEAFTSALK